MTPRPFNSPAETRERDIRNSELGHVMRAFNGAVALVSLHGSVLSASPAFAQVLSSSDTRAPQQDLADLRDLMEPGSHAKLSDFAAPQPERSDGPDGATRLTVPLEIQDRAQVMATFSHVILGDGRQVLLCELEPDRSEEDELLRFVFEENGQGIWSDDLRTGKFHASKAWMDMRGITGGYDECRDTTDWLAKVHPDDREKLVHLAHEQLEGRADTYVLKYRYRHVLGHYVWIMCHATVMKKDAAGLPLLIVGTDTDITNLQDREWSLMELTDKLQLAIEAAEIGIWEFDPITESVHWDDRMLRIYGITDGQNRRMEDLWATYLHPEDYDGTLAYAEECQERGTDFKRDYRIVRPNGEIRHVRSMARSVSTSDSKTKLIGINVDITEDKQLTLDLKQAQRKLQHDALHDTLTGLGNRRKADAVVSKLFQTMAEDARYAILQVDLDHFKDVNDTLGHAAGDHVLRMAARCLEQSIGAQGEVFRMGGDEFTILLFTCPPQPELDTQCAEIIRDLQRPNQFGGQDCNVGASIGYTLEQGPPATHSLPFSRADAALYAAKAAGRGCARMFDAGMSSDVASAVSREGLNVRKALARGEIQAVFQPIYDARTLTICAAEALVRWNCPERGLLTPDKFLSSASRAGMLAEIDEAVLTFVLDQQDTWCAQGRSFPRISLNLSRDTLLSDTWLPGLQSRLEAHHAIAFELLETAFMDRVDPITAHRLDTLREMGLRIEMDDFGAGHASIVALQSIKPNGVKIDRDLVLPLEKHARQIETLEALCRIARLENCDIVIEGLETGIHMAAVHNLDCDALQGYALERPMSAEAFTERFALQKTA